MLKRSITGAVIVVLTVGFFFLREIDYRFFNIMFLAMSAFGTFEMLRANGQRITKSAKITTFVFALLTVPLTTFFGYYGLLGVTGGYAVVMLSLLVFDYDNVTVENLGSAMLCYVYPNMLICAMVLMNALGMDFLAPFGTKDSAKYAFSALLISFSVCPATDVFAYLVGCTLKGPKACPKISPKKTISGYIGGLVGGIAISVCLYFILGATDALPVITGFPTIAVFIITGVVASAFTELGDLIESVIKRKNEIKDMGTLFPGHGGMMDRIDGLIFASVIVFVVFRIIVSCI